MLKATCKCIVHITVRVEKGKMLVQILSTNWSISLSLILNRAANAVRKLTYGSRELSA